MPRVTGSGRSDSWARIQCPRGLGLQAANVGLHAILVLVCLGAAPTFAQCTVEQMLTPSDDAGQFGSSFDIDGDTAVVGAPHTLCEAGLGACGAAYVFVRTGTLWTEQARLAPFTASEQHEFGHSVAVDGDTIVIAAQYGDPRVFVFVREGETWTEQATLSAPEESRALGYGISVAVDKDIAVVGDNYYRHAPLLATRGGAFVFVRTGGVWTEKATLTASNILEAHDFGNSVSLSGETIVVGAPRGPAHHVYVFVRQGGVWTQQARFTSEIVGDPIFSDGFAFDGDTLIFGGRNYAHIFVRFGRLWVKQAELSIFPETNLFTSSVALDGDMAVVAGRLVFVRNGLGQWTKQRELTAPDGINDSLVYSAVSVDGDTVGTGPIFGPDIGLVASMLIFRCSFGGAPAIQPDDGGRDGDAPDAQPIPGDGADDGPVDQNPCGVLSLVSLTFLWLGMLGLRWSHSHG